MATINMLIGEKRRLSVGFTVGPQPTAIPGLVGLSNNFGILSFVADANGLGGVIEATAAGTSWINLSAPSTNPGRSVDIYVVAPLPTLTGTDGGPA